MGERTASTGVVQTGREDDDCLTAVETVEGTTAYVTDRVDGESDVSAATEGTPRVPSHGWIMPRGSD